MKKLAILHHRLRAGRSACMILCSLMSTLHQAKGMEPADVFEAMRPYLGAHDAGVDTTTLKGKVMCGYQGWFAAPGDGSGRGWVHFGVRGRFDQKHCTIDLWPDVAEMDQDEKYPTSFTHTGGETAFVFSSYNRKTVLRHFKWMKQHGIDGVFLQRFGSSVRKPNSTYHHRNVVTANVQAGANLHGRTWALMYDLSGLKRGEIETVVKEDWKRLVDLMQIRRDKAYLHHRGKPVVAVWGIGFNDGRKYTLDECEELVKFLKSDQTYGGNTVMLGVPTGWRTLDRDSSREERLHQIIKQADIVSPWTVGRYASPQAAVSHAEKVVAPDVRWARKQGLDYMPVVFPGFSWHNLQKMRGKKTAPDQIPRLEGRFLWAQGTSFVQAGANMLYVAMFDEIDEGTAIFKCSNTPPSGDECRFMDYDGLPSDHYLWLTGKLRDIVNKRLPLTDTVPKRQGD